MIIAASAGYGGAVESSDEKSSVFVLQHVHELPDGSEDVKLVGIYSDKDAARAAQTELSNQPGFSAYPEGFEISEYVLNATHWREGFVEVDEA